MGQTMGLLDDVASISLDGRGVERVGAGKPGCVSALGDA